NRINRIKGKKGVQKLLAFAGDKHAKARSFCTPQTSNLSFYAMISYCRTTLTGLTELKAKKECKSFLLLPETNMQKQEAFALRRPRT
ncbi:hypothetical protein QUF64_15290, partial [Anaerolineales bacterium HSG6]|nr:hypothetical protein [Anaerolineales bacterium HSG6]